MAAGVAAAGHRPDSAPASTPGGNVTMEQDRARAGIPAAQRAWQPAARDEAGCTAVLAEAAPGGNHQRRCPWAATQPLPSSPRCSSASTMKVLAAGRGGTRRSVPQMAGSGRRARPAHVCLLAPPAQTAAALGPMPSRPASRAELTGFTVRHLGAPRLQLGGCSAQARQQGPGCGQQLLGDAPGRQLLHGERHRTRGGCAEGGSVAPRLPGCSGAAWARACSARDENAVIRAAPRSAGRSLWGSAALAAAGLLMHGISAARAHPAQEQRQCRQWQGREASCLRHIPRQLSAALNCRCS